MTLCISCHGYIRQNTNRCLEFSVEGSFSVTGSHYAASPFLKSHRSTVGGSMERNVAESLVGHRKETEIVRTDLAVAGGPVSA